MSVSNLSRQLARLAVVAFGLTTVACMLQANAFAVDCKSNIVNKSCTLYISDNMTVSPDTVFVFPATALTWKHVSGKRFHLHFSDSGCAGNTDYDSSTVGDLTLTVNKGLIHCGYMPALPGSVEALVSIDPHVIIIGSSGLGLLGFPSYELLFWLLLAASAAKFAFGKLRSRSAS